LRITTCITEILTVYTFRFVIELSNWGMLPVTVVTQVTLVMEGRGTFIRCIGRS
jgi:hypothetical protein